ncbi:unnamed protein product, partial [Prorocentrum cordatum]
MQMHRCTHTHIDTYEVHALLSILDVAALLAPLDGHRSGERNGSIFASVADILDGSTELHPGAPCEFHICEDDSGLGAEEIIETGPPDPAAIPQEKGKSGPKGAGKPAGKAFGKPASPWGGDKGFGKAPTKAYSKGWGEPYGGKGGAYSGGKGKDLAL